ncbi:MAG: 4a-hydroxytetrahydrobiopterin dehydratase [Candidatus Nanohaloarchaea archaeon]|nr:4a-hydroxytetrahydrobiopterin dehydratase [Candidatus Nanohaloarchaea archaeon]
MSALSDEKCVPCQGGIPPMEPEEIQDHLDEVDDGWEVKRDHHITRHFEFDDFEEALEFVNEVGEVAEEEGHHPNIEFTWGEADVTFYTHKIDGLHKNDFRMAAKVDEVYEEGFAT